MWKGGAGKEKSGVMREGKKEGERKENGTTQFGQVHCFLSVDFLDYFQSEPCQVFCI